MNFSHPEIDAKDFLFGGIASSMATVFTNPLEVVKTRLQLQGEMNSGKQPYKNLFQGIYLIAKNDGIIALAVKGLAPSLYFQFILNSCRLGIYTTAGEYGLTKKKDNSVSILKSALWGGIGGFMGQALATPFFMLRTHMMSKTSSNIAVGYQHKSLSMFDAFKEIYVKHGIKGLYRGVSITLPRGIMGSGSQLAAFGLTKEVLQRKTNMNETYISLFSGLVAGTAMAIAMTPPDTLATRIFNQPVDAHGKGIYYSGVFDCLSKTLKNEGFATLYRGFWPHYIRIGPHSALVLVFFDEIKAFFGT